VSNSAVCEHSQQGGVSARAEAALLIDLQRLSINDPKDMLVRKLSFLDGRFPAIVIDNFYRDPDHVRSVALGLHYLPPSDGWHPGYSAVLSVSMEPMLRFLHGCLASFYFPTLESFLRQARPWLFHRWEPAGARKQRPVSSRPHRDDSMLAGVLYLNLPDQCRGGTAFYRHKETGTEALIPERVVSRQGPRAQVDEQVVEKMKATGALDAFLRWKQTNEGPAKGYSTYSSTILGAPGADEGFFITDSAGEWERTQLLEMKFNRLVVYPAFLMHSAYYRPEWFGTEADSCRLTQNFFFDWPNTLGEQKDE